MQKGASNTDLKKNPPPDDDFGKDFFNSWKSAKLGNDSIDFDVDAVPKNKNASFKFDELDDFELSGNFNKLSSLKLDVPDLDFTLPSKKNEKAHEMSSKEIATGKKESKEDKFSFDFDFKSFDFDTKSLEDKRPSNLSDKKVPEHSSNHETDQESSDNISTSNNISKEVSVVAEDNEKETSVIMAQREHSHGKYFPTKSSGNNQDFCFQTSSDDGSAEITLLGIPTINAPLNVVKPRPQMERDNPMQPICSSPSKSSSPVDSYNSGYWTKVSGKVSLNQISEFQKHQSQEPLTRISGRLTDLSQIKKEVYCSTRPKKTIVEVQNIDEKQNPCRNIILPHKGNSHQNMQPPLKRFGGSTKLRGLIGTGLQLHTISELKNNIPQQSPALISKPFNSMMEARTKSTHASISNDSSLQFQPSSVSCQTSIAAKSIAEPSLQKLSTDASIDVKDPSTENCKPTLVSSAKLGSHIIKTNKDASLGDNNHCDIINSAIAKTIELNNNKTNSKSREPKSVHFLEKKMDCPLNAANLVNIEKHVPSHAPLKRKIDEEPLADLKTSSPLKFVKESTAGRRISFKASQNTKSKMVPETRTTEICEDVMPVTNLTAATEIRNLVAGFSSNLEDDDNLRKSETYTKGLDNICSMLRKKHEEAKELMVHSIINNNALLLLNFSVPAENIQELQKFTTSLLMQI